MEVSFVRTPSGCDSIVRFDGGRSYRIRNPGSFLAVPPHDLRTIPRRARIAGGLGFWGYVARGVVFPGMSLESGNRPPHGEERSRAAIRAAKDFLAETEMLAGAIADLARAGLDDDPRRATAALADGWWPPHSLATKLPMADRRACDLFRRVAATWPQVPMNEALVLRWSLRRHPLAPKNPLDAESERREQRRSRSARGRAAHASRGHNP